MVVPATVAAAVAAGARRALDFVSFTVPQDRNDDRCPTVGHMYTSPSVAAAA
jgi:hypothetical protein